MRKIVLSVFMVLLLCFQVVAQNQRVSGTVTDQSGQTVIGATVQLKGTNVATATDLDGQYSISAPANGVLVFSSIGSEPQEHAIGGRTVIDVQLSAASESIETLVFIGYGSGTEIANVVGSHTSIGGAELSSKPSPNVADAMQGKVAGMQSWVSSGEPGATASIRVRGVSSINLSTDPLYILDGVPVSGAVFNTLNAYDIENVTVLKDAASTAIYGSRAANGVVYITSKKGRRGQAPKLNVNAYYGVGFNTNTQLRLMTAEELIRFEEKVYPTQTSTAEYAWLKNQVLNYGLDFNWENYFFDKAAPNYNLNAEIAGGSESVRYLFSFGYLNKKGTSIRSSMDRYNFRANIDADITGNFKMGANVSLATVWGQPTITGWYLQSPLGGVFSELPYKAPYKHEIIDDKLQYGQRLTKYDWGAQFYDLFYYYEKNQEFYRDVNLNGSMYQEWRPFKGLTIRATQAMDASDYLLERAQLYSYENTEGLARKDFTRSYTLNANNTIDYKHTFGENHNLSLLLGQEAIVYNAHGFMGYSAGMTDDRLMTLSSGIRDLMTSGESYDGYAMNSYFFQADYNFANKYYLSGTIRRDGSSMFGPDKKWGNFYSFGGMWDIKKENFLQNVDVIDMLRFRVNYGEMGNSDIGSYTWRATMASSSASSYDGVNGMWLYRPGNSELSWETVGQFTVGVNGRLFDRADFTIEWYDKTSRDLLMEVAYSAATGFRSGYSNIGRMRNRGLDMELSVDLVSTKDFYWGINANASYFKNTILSLYNGIEQMEITVGGASTGLFLNVGESVGSFSDVRRVGVDPYDGALVWLTKDGGLTKTYSEDNRVSTGMNQYANWTGGFGTQLSWKNVNLAMDFVWCGPKYAWLNEYLYTRNSSTAFQGSNREYWMMDIWTEPWQLTQVPAQGTPFYFDDSVYSNAAFIRLKNVTLSYTLPEKIMSKTNGFLTGARVYLTGRNLLTITNYQGYDPEIDTNGSQFRYPNSREVVVGVELTF